jgi:transposase
MSLSDEQRARIRALFYAEHWKVGTIAAELGVHPDAVRSAVGTETFVSRGPKARANTLEPFASFITQTLKQFPRLRATRLYDMLVPRGFEGSERQLRRHVAQVRPRPAPEAFLRLTRMPGEQGQMDWAKFGVVSVAGGERKLSCFAMVLPWSRLAYARFTLDERMDSFLRGHVEAFEAFGGAPRQMLYDNLKSAVLERVGEHIRFHPELLELASHYHFIPPSLRPTAGQREGKRGAVHLVPADLVLRGPHLRGHRRPQPPARALAA